MQNKIIPVAILAILVAGAIVFYNLQHPRKTPTVAIANWGPNPSLQDSIDGIKQELTDQGYTENKNINYKIADAGFDKSLISPMIQKLISPLKPDVLVVIATPVSQNAKNTVKDIPIVYSTVTDPVEADLIKTYNNSNNNITGSSDKQELGVILKFAKKLIPDARTVGLLYSSAENNHQALVNMMGDAALNMRMSLISVQVSNLHDIPKLMQEFEDKVDFIYVGASATIQQALPTISAQCKKMKIPLFNDEEKAVRDGMAFASFGVSYNSVGKKAGKLVAELLNGKSISELTPIYPSTDDYRGVINKKMADEYGIKIPNDVKNLVECCE